MAAQQTKDKEQFFADLDRLDQLADESEDNASDQLAKGAESPDIESAQLNPSKKTKSSSPRQTSTSDPTLIPASAAPTRPSTSGGLHETPSQFAPRPATLRRIQSAGNGRKSTGPKKGKKQEEVVPKDKQLFRGLTFFFIPNNDKSSVRRTRIKSAIAYGARWARVFGPGVTHVIVDAGLDITEASKDFPNKVVPGNVPIVCDTWVVDSYTGGIPDPKRARFRVPGMKSALAATREFPSDGGQGENAEGSSDRASFKARPEPANGSTSGDTAAIEDELDRAICETRGAESTSAMLPEDDSFAVGIASLTELKSPLSQLVQAVAAKTAYKGFLCMEKHDGTMENANGQTIKFLQELSEKCEESGDRFRLLAYRKAIAGLRKQSSLIKTKVEALNIHGIGESIASQIEEIATKGSLRRLDGIKDDPDHQLRQLFKGIYGAGEAQASRWIAQGYRSLDDVAQRAELTANQKIGVDHYDEFQQRIPRDEVAQHAQIVRQVSQVVDLKLEVIVAGSYRRGNLESGDIDLLVTKLEASMEHIRTLMMENVVPELTRQGFLKTALATSFDRQGSKWHGACVLPGSSVWRRLDLLFVPWDELGAALMYFTGNQLFNRSMRLLARKQGMRLNQHGLYKDVIRGKGGVKINDGTLLEGRDERRIFELLGVTYRPPGHRRC